jgi:EpsD family peptidyl-prolyl cis-trans isomerase
MPTTLKRAPLSAAASLLLVFLLSACGDKETKPVTTQVAAKVGSEEISVHQINQVLSRANAASASPEAAAAMRKDVLEKLIDQQLAVDQAIEAKLQRTPDVVAQIEAARRDVLARAYVQQITSAQPKPSSEDTKKYYAEHPQLFAERRVYSLQELLVPRSSGVTADQMRSQISAGKTMEDIATWLKNREVKVSGGSATRAAEQIPLELLSKVHALRDGQMAVIEAPQGITVLRVVASQSAPVSEVNALPRIEQFLFNQRSAAAVAQKIKDLRSKASITYMGDFAKATSEPPNTIAAPTPAVPTETTRSDGGSMTTPAPGADEKIKSALEKGVAGLK